MNRDHSRPGEIQLPPGAILPMRKLGRTGVEGRKRGEVTTARDETQDAKLKKLPTEILPTLQKHLDTAQKIADGTPAR